VASATQWNQISFQYGMEASSNATTFSPASRPSQRTLVIPTVGHSSDVQWISNTRYPLDEIASLLQAVVQQPGWASGNAVSLVLRGTGNAWGRKFARAFEADLASAPRLVVTYTTP